MNIRRPWLLPLVPLYAAGVHLRHRFPGPATTLQQPVISVGSIAAGGAGKTPFLAALARLLQGDGETPDVLSRGYGRSSRGVLRVDPTGTAAMFGDEPLMLARSLGIPVFVGESRHAAGLLAESQGTSSVHLLDDGFSHRALTRTLDIALLTREDAHDTLLPAGNLREPLAHLGRADVLVLRAEEAAALQPLARRLLGPEKPIWIIRRTLVLPEHMPPRPLLFSAIARPADFEADVQRAGVERAAIRRFRDHHALTAREIDALCRDAAAVRADGFLTTAKDAVKLPPAAIATLQRLGPVAVADAVVTFADPIGVLHDLRERLGDSARSGDGRSH